MRAILTDETAPVYPSIEDQSISIATLQRDEEFELGKVVSKKRKVWVEITLDSGATGYISGDVHIFALKKVELLSADAEMRSGPSAESDLIRPLKKGDVFFTLKVEKTDQGSWVRVRDQFDSEGYIVGNAKIRIIQPVKRSDAKKTLILGGIMILIGAIFGFISYSGSQQNPISYYLALGFIVFGVLQLMQGFIQYRQAIAQEKQEAEKPGGPQPQP